MNSEVFDKSVFAKFFQPGDTAVKNWADNVFEKIQSSEILPKFINRNNWGFRAFWYPICVLFGYIVCYVRKYQDISQNTLLFKRFVESKGLISDELDLSDSSIFLENYINEFRKRGTVRVFEKGVPYNGEFLRLIDYREGDGYLITYLAPQDTGWCQGTSSPCWNRTTLTQSINKGWENTREVEDLSNYPHSTGCEIGSINIPSLVDGISSLHISSGEPVFRVGYAPSRSISTIRVPSGGRVGDSVTTNPLSFEVDNRVDYEFFFHLTLLDSGNLTVQIFADSTLTNSKTGATSTNCIEDQRLPEGEYFVRVRLFKTGHSTNSNTYNVFRSNDLIMSSDVTKIIPKVTWTADDNTSYADIWDIKFKPEYLPWTQGYLGRKGIILGYVKNNSTRSREEILEFTNRYLISYKNLFIYKELE